jgi:hypothetical protein
MSEDCGSQNVQFILEGEYKMMRRRKVSDALLFNPAVYDHLDKATLKDFVAEFLVRNEQFRKDYAELWEVQSSSAEVNRCLFYMDLNYKVNFTMRENYEETLTPKNLKFHLNPPVAAIRLIPENETERVKEVVCKKENFLKRDDLVSAHWCKFATVDTDHEGEPGYMNIKETSDRFLMPGPEGDYIYQDTLLLAIDLNSTKDQIMKDVERLLSIHKDSRRSRLRLDLWKYYLIVYDLAKKGANYSEISSMLAKAYPANEKLYSERNIENYLNMAEKLIAGDYQKYL